MDWLCDISAEKVRDLFTYDPEDGFLRWRNDAGIGGRFAAGSVAGTLNKEKYRYVNIGGRHYKSSRVAWLYMTGEWPTEQVDHIDRNTSNDKWLNLRLATQSQNKANCRAYKKKSCTLKGVQAVQKRRSIRYRAIATKDGVREHLGYFDTELEAHMAYIKRANQLHGAFASNGMEAA